MHGTGADEKSDRTKAREAFFLEFAKAIRSSFPNVPLMVTGGFRTRQGMEAAVAEGGCDLVGLARPAALNPTLPKNMVFNPEVKDEDAKLFTKKVKVPWIMKQIGPGVGSGAESVSLLSGPRMYMLNPYCDTDWNDQAWYSARIREMAKL